MQFSTKLWERFVTSMQFSTKLWERFVTSMQFSRMADAEVCLQFGVNLLKDPVRG